MHSELRLGPSYGIPAQDDTDTPRALISRFSDGAISHVGATFTGEVEEEIDGQRLFVIPGLVNIHAHPSLEPSFKGVREEHGVPEMYMTGLYERCATIEPDEDGQRAGTEVAYAELLMSGVTTLADLSFPYPGWVDLAAKSGMRLYLAPWYASSSWYVDNRHQLKFHWKKDHGARRIRARPETHRQSRDASKRTAAGTALSSAN